MCTEKYQSDCITCTDRQAKLEQLFSWLQEQWSLEHSIENVLDIVCKIDKKTDRNKVQSCMSASIKMYKVTSYPSLLPYYFYGQDIDFKKSQICSDICRIRAPEWVAKRHLQGSIPNMCVNILSKRYCISKIQVENLYKECAWMPSKFLFSVIAGIVLSGQPIPQGKTNNDCIVYIRGRSSLKKHRVSVSPLTTLEGFGDLRPMSDVPYMSYEDKESLILCTLIRILGVSYSQLVGDYREEFRFALLVTIYWVNSSEVNRRHIASLLAGWVSLYEEKQQSGQEKPPGTAVRPKKTKNKTKNETKKIDPDISHGFAQWQICMLYALRLNDLLQRPLPPCPDISVLFSGVLMHSIYSRLQNEFDEEKLLLQVKTIFETLQNAPRAYELFLSMYNFIIKRVVNESDDTEEQKPSSQTSGKRKIPGSQQQSSCQETHDEPSADAESDSDSDSEWNTSKANNKFGALSIDA